MATDDLRPARPTLPRGIALALLRVSVWCRENGYVVKIFRKES